MRKLLITRGFQGVGKSTLLRKLELQDYVLCADDLRNLFASPELQLNGQWSINHQNENIVWQFLFDRLESRMKNGDFVVVDAMHLLPKSIQPYLKLAQTYHYEIACIDFQNFPIEQALINNQQRAAHRQIPENVIISCKEKLSNHPKIQNGVHHILWQADLSHELQLKSWLCMDPIDLSHYQKIHHIGDLQGCFEVLETYLNGEIKSDEFYIFVGDYFDRGLENAMVAKWLLAHAQAENIVFLWGNHEDILAKDLRGEAVDDPYYLQRTKIEFQNHQIELEAFRPFLRQCKDLYLYQYQGKIVYCSHAGFDCIPKQAHLLSTIQLQSGIGAFQYDVDTFFEADAQKPENAHVYQVHGHRNANMYEMDRFKHSFNLEGNVEFGGDLRCVVLDAGGFQPIAIPNPKYCVIQNRILTFYSFIPHWIRKNKKEQLEHQAKHQLEYQDMLSIFQTYFHGKTSKPLNVQSPESFLILMPSSQNSERNHSQEIQPLSMIELSKNHQPQLLSRSKCQEIFDQHHFHVGKQKHLDRQLKELSAILLLTQSNDTQIIAMLGPSVQDIIFANDLKQFLKNYQWPILKNEIQVKS